MTRATEDPSHLCESDYYRVYLCKRPLKSTRKCAVRKKLKPHSVYAGTKFKDGFDFEISDAAVIRDVIFVRICIAEIFN